MCEFCVKHGEGKKWYLEAKNYSDDLLNDVRRRRFIVDFLSKPANLAKEEGDLDRLEKAPPFIRGIMKRVVSNRQKKVHYGQVVPIEELGKIFEFVNAVVRVPCICRHVTLGQEKRYCYGISIEPGGGKYFDLMQKLEASYLHGPSNLGLESLSPKQALSDIRGHEQDGLCHTIWSFHTPFIGAVCNCDRSDCLAMRATVTHAVPVMFRAEYVAEVDPLNCIGCRECMRMCQFGAIGYSAGIERAVIDQRSCYGCGVCRSACGQGAIRLEEREKIPAAAHLW
jgi:ferredoxin